MTDTAPQHRLGVLTFHYVNHCRSWGYKSMVECLQSNMHEVQGTSPQHPKNNQTNQ